MHRCTATALSYLGNVNVTRSRHAIEGSSDGEADEPLLAEKGPSTTSSALCALQGRKETGQSVVTRCQSSRREVLGAGGVHASSSMLAATLGKHGNLFWVRFSRDTRVGQSRQIFILRGRLPSRRCSDRISDPLSARRMKRWARRE